MPDKFRLKCACGVKVFCYENLVAASLEEWKRITLSVRSSDSNLCRNPHKTTRKDHAEADKNLSNRELAPLFIVFRTLFIISTTFSMDYMHQLNSLYVLHIVTIIYLLSMSGSTHARTESI